MAIFKNITRKDYGKIEGVNASRLKPYFESSLNGNYHENKQRVESAAMAFGTASHSLILEPGKFNKLYQIVNLPINPRTGEEFGAGTKKALEYLSELPSCFTYLSSDDMNLLKTMESNIKENANAVKILELCPMRETAITWVDENTGLSCKALIDFMGDKIVGDYKTTRSLPFKGDLENSANSLKWDLIKNGNLLQFAFYYDGVIANGIDIEKFAVIFAKNCDNCDTATGFLTDETLQIGREMYEQSLTNWLNRESNKSAFNEIMDI